METRYSIRDLEQLSGIKAHTIRAWEQRYKLIEPKRTSTNIRYYGDEELRKVLNTAILLNAGHKIGTVAKMQANEIAELALEASPYQGIYEREINDLKLQTLSFDIYGFEATIKMCVLKYGAHKTFKDIIGDYVELLGKLWLAGTVSISQEHFMSSLIRQKLFAALDSLPLPEQGKKNSYAIFLPANELHEIGVLYLSYVLREQGHTVYYLGQSLPKEYLVDLLNAQKVDGLVSCFTTSPETDSLPEFLLELDQLAQNHSCKVHITGYQLSNLEEVPQLTHTLIYDSLKELSENL